MKVNRMAFELRANRKVAKALKSLDTKLKEKIKQLFLILKANPTPVKRYDVVKIRGLENTYRIRVQKIRIIYSVEWEKHVVEILKVTKRKESTYKRL